MWRKKWIPTMWKAKWSSKSGRKIQKVGLHVETKSRQSRTLQVEGKCRNFYSIFYISLELFRVDISDDGFSEVF